MISKLKPKSEFSRNVLTLMTGTTIAQAIPIAISPILTRIYTPEDFGVFALFISITTILGLIANARYELAIMLPIKDDNALNIAALGLAINSMLTLVIFVIVIIFNRDVSLLLNNDEISFWLYFVPLVVFLTGLFNVLNYYNNRIKHYKDIAQATIYKSLVMASLQLILGIMKDGAAGLISGQIISNLFANIKLLKNTIKNKDLKNIINIKKIIVLSRKYINFPKYSLLAVLLNSLSIHSVNIFISLFYNIGTLGFYSLVLRVLSVPSLLIGSSIGQVLFQEASAERKVTGSASNSFHKAIKKLFIIGFPLFTILFFIVEDLFALVFGENWKIAGQYAQILTILFFVRFISSTMSVYLIVFEKQKIELFINIILLSSAIFLFYSLNELDFLFLLKIYVFIFSIYYIIFLFYYYKLSRNYK